MSPFLYDRFLEILSEVVEVRKGSADFGDLHSRLIFTNNSNGEESEVQVYRFPCKWRI